MNNLYGKTSEEGDKVYLEVLGHKIELPKNKAKVLKGTKHANAEVIIGIRPENITCDEEKLKDANVILTGKVDVAENLGAETYLYLLVDNRNMVIKTPTSKGYASGDEIRYTFDINKIHLFDKEEQNTIF